MVADVKKTEISERFIFYGSVTDQIFLDIFSILFKEDIYTGVSNDCVMLWTQIII